MTFTKYLGEGTYGSLNLFCHKKISDGSTSYAAVKTSDHKSIEREFQVLSELKGCPSIVQVIGDTLLHGPRSEFQKMMLLEYAAGGSLRSFIKSNKNIPDSTIKDFTRMILQGLVSIHSHGYIHCDIKPANILLFPRCDGLYDLKIADFGLTIKAGESSDIWDIGSPFAGTPHYMSPESVDGGGLIEKTLDLWSLGCVVLEMYTGEYPWSGVSLNDIEGNLADGNAPEIPDIVPRDARQFIETCFARKLEDRGTASKLLLHPFLTEESNGMVLRGRRTTVIKGDIVKKTSTLKVISPQFKKISNKTQRIKLLPPRAPISTFVPVQ